ncbi:hypothetical protein DWZ09_17890 [Bacteroides cellulosilyticus]|nr:hypothetical protein DWZ09_17890 [Bacteroides cellulosilyticus]
MMLWFTSHNSKSHVIPYLKLLYKPIMMKYLYKFGLNYITPVIRIQLSYNRLYRVPKFRTPKNEINDIHWGIIILVFSEILIQMVIPFFVYARLWHPAPKNLVYSVVVIAAIVAILFMQKVKKEKVYENLTEEANKLTKEEHKARRKALIPTFLLYYMLPIAYVMPLCALFQYLIPKGYLL